VRMNSFHQARESAFPLFLTVQTARILRCGPFSFCGAAFRQIGVVKCDLRPFFPPVRGRVLGSISGPDHSSRQGPDGGCGTLRVSGWRERSEAGHDCNRRARLPAARAPLRAMRTASR